MPGSQPRLTRRKRLLSCSPCTSAILCSILLFSRPCPGSRSRSSCGSSRRRRRRSRAAPGSARSLENAVNVILELGHGRRHVLRQHVAKRAKGVHLAAHELVAPADELDKLARVNIRVASVFDVFEQLGRHRGQVVGRRGGCVEGLEGAGEGFAARLCPLLAGAVFGDIMGGGDAGAHTFRWRARLCLGGPWSRRLRLGP